MKLFLRIVIIAAVVSVGIVAASAQVSSTLWIKVSSSGETGPDSMIFGVHNSATYGVDAGTPLFESEGPPNSPPDESLFDAWQDPRGTGFGQGVQFGLFRKDMREFIDPAQIDTFLLYAQGDSGFSLTLTWGSSAFLSTKVDSIFLLDGTTGGAVYNIDMKSQTSLTLAYNEWSGGGGIRTFIIIRYGAKIVDAVPTRSGNAVPQSFSLHQNYPNPFNPTTSISFDLKKQAVAEIAVFDVVGRKVATLVSQPLSAGTYSTTWNGLNDRGITVGSGIYYVRMIAHSDETGSNEGTFTAVRKLLLMK